MTSCSDDFEVIPLFPKRISPLVQSDQLPINSPPVGFRFGLNVFSRNSAKARFTELSIRSLNTWSDSFFSLSLDQLDLAQLSTSLLFRSLNLFAEPFKAFSNNGLSNEILIPWWDFFSEFWLLINQSNRLLTALNL